MIENYLCECNDPQSFGKHCEYLLPFGRTFKMTLDWENEMKSLYEEQNQYDSDILCYVTLICNSGLLCLDWRDICDGIQQCQLGFDEENCDLIEFNECESVEYRCMNGMCIPQEYFLDGDYDCMDLSDEIHSFNDTLCTFEETSLECDDRICPPDEWSCGDGQCIHNRIAFQIRYSGEIECNSRRDQYHICETHNERRRWTLSNGKCFFNEMYREFNSKNRSEAEECIYFSKCALSMGLDWNCPCTYNFFCFYEEMSSPCSSSNIQYPNGAIVAPYIFFIYYDTRDWWGKTSDYIILNATIKCRGYIIDRHTIMPYLSKINLKDIEASLCNSVSNSSMLFDVGYDLHCHNNSRTFNNHTYYFVDVCEQSKECISAYRINDGYKNCADEMDEQQSHLVLTLCSKYRRYRFRCSIDEPTCLTVTHLGNLSPDCKNNYDEWWMGTDRMLSQMKCNKKSKDDCEILRQYIEMSWNGNIDVQLSITKISFRTYCDTFWNLGSKKDEDAELCSKWWVCLDGQWQCRTGQCIDITWVLDGEWDCTDASDEESFFFLNDTLLTRTRNIFNFSELIKKFNGLHGKSHQPFSEICDLTIEFPCFRVNISDPLINITLKRPCISFEQVGDGHIDCIGGIDERNNLQHCHYPTMLGNDFLCVSSKTCIDKSALCKTGCPNRSDDHILCYDFMIPFECSSPALMFCINGECVPENRCDTKYGCSYGEDEYMCDRSVSMRKQFENIFYRRSKESMTKNIYQKVQLPPFPTNINSNFVNSSIIESREVITTVFNLTSSPIPYYCNRGVGVFLYNGSIICFCPPQYYGDKCQFYNDRLSVILHLNLSQSFYTESTNETTLIKLLVLFLFENETLSIREFHVRPAFEMAVFEKKIGHFVYSRSDAFLNNKRKRYFNRSNIINEHPYSIRIEAYELNINVKPQIIAVWQYPIYFDYLPSFRFSKVLRLISLDKIENPCSSNPCPSHEECHPLLNQKLKYICLCSSHFTGENCSDTDEMCIEGFCSQNALCKPNYRNILNGNEKPYCICPLNQYGRRCDLLYDKCLSNPCQNNGVCFPSSKPDQFSCKCTPEFDGDLCELQNEAVILTINESPIHEGAVIQYFYMNYYSLELILAHQDVFRRLPNVLFYLHGTNTAPEIILAKLYTNGEARIYLISIQFDVTSINVTTYMKMVNLCKDVRSLFPWNEGMSSKDKYLF